MILIKALDIVIELAENNVLDVMVTKPYSLSVEGS